MERKIIQLAIMPEGDMTQPAVIGLCNDGSVMVLSESKSYWTELTPIPQKPVERNFIGQNPAQVASRAYREGHNDRVDKKSVEQNPYAKQGSTKEITDWREGWTRAAGLDYKV